MKIKAYLIVVTVLFTLTGCGDDKGVAAVAAKPRPVKLLTVTTSDSSLLHSYPAVVSAAEAADLAFQVGGVVEQLLVKEGQQVQAGTIIARLNSDDFNSALISAKAQYRNAQSNLERGQKLVASGTISDSQLDELESNRNVTLAAFQQAQKAVNDAVLIAPFSGVIAKLPIERFDNVSAGELVASVLATELMKVTINVPAATIVAAKQSQDWRSYLTLSSLPQVRFDATFNSAQLEADPSSQTYAVHFSIKVGEQHLVLPGMHGKLWVQQQQHYGTEGQVRLPLTAIMSAEGETFVWLYDAATQRLQKRIVQLASGSAEQATVTAGLQAGEQVVVAGGVFLAEGLAVRPWQP